MTNTINPIAQVNTLAHALKYFEDRSVLLGEQFDEIRGRLTSLKKSKEALEQGKETRPIEIPTGQLSKADRDALQASNSENSQLARLVGSISTPQFEAQLGSIRLQINEVQEAGARGLISHYEMAATLSGLEARYKKMAKGLEAYHGGKVTQKVVSSLQEAPGAAAGFVQDQVEGIGSGIMGKISSLPVAGGLFGLMAYGYMERNRLDSQAAVMSNILRSSGDPLSSDLVESLSAFQEKADRYLSISKSEVQGVVSSVIRAGGNISEILGGTRKELGEVGENLVTLTTALDHHFQIASGSSVELTLELWKQHGVNIGTAADQLIKLDMAAQHAGVGVGDFTTFVVKSSGELANYGTSGEEVGSALLAVQHSYVQTGLSAQTAMSFAKAGMGEVTKGIQSLSSGLKIKIGEMLGMGKGLEASQRLQDSAMHGDHHNLEHILKALNQIAEAETSGNHRDSSEVRRRAYLEHAGMGFNGAELIVKLADKYHGQFELAKMTIEEQEQLKLTFSDQQKTMGEVMSGAKRLLQGMSNMGQGILQMLVNFAGLATVTIRGLLLLDMLDVASMMGASSFNSVAKPLGSMLGVDLGVDPTAWSKHGAQFAKVSDNMSVYQNRIAEGATQFQSGFEQTAEGIKQIAQPIAGNVTEAIKSTGSTPTNFDVGGGTSFSPTRIGNKSEGVAALEQMAISSHVGTQSGISDQFLIEGEKMAERLGIPFEELLLAMNTESGISAKRKANFAESRGLLQFTPDTLKNMGWKGTMEEFASLSELEQLPWVEKYLKPLARSGLTSDARIHQALALPASLSIGKNRDDVILRKGGNGYGGKENGIYNSYQATFDPTKRGYITVGDFEKSDIFYGKRSDRYKYAIQRLHELHINSNFTATAQVTKNTSGNVVALQIKQNGGGAVQSLQ